MGVGRRKGKKEGYSIRKGDIAIIPFLFTNKQNVVERERDFTWLCNTYGQNNDSSDPIEHTSIFFFFFF